MTKALIAAPCLCHHICAKVRLLQAAANPCLSMPAEPWQAGWGMGTRQTGHTSEGWLAYGSPATLQIFLSVAQQSTCLSSPSPSYGWSVPELLLLLAPSPFSLTGVFPNKSQTHLILSWYLFLGGPRWTHDSCDDARSVGTPTAFQSSCFLCLIISSQLSS